MKPGFWNASLKVGFIKHLCIMEIKMSSSKHTHTHPQRYLNLIMAKSIMVNVLINIVLTRRLSSLSKILSTYFCVCPCKWKNDGLYVTKLWLKWTSRSDIGTISQNPLCLATPLIRKNSLPHQIYDKEEMNDLDSLIFPRVCSAHIEAK